MWPPVTLNGAVSQQPLCFCRRDCGHLTSRVYLRDAAAQCSSSYNKELNINNMINDQLKQLNLTPYSSRAPEINVNDWFGINDVRRSSREKMSHSVGASSSSLSHLLVEYRHTNRVGDGWYEPPSDMFMVLTCWEWNSETREAASWSSSTLICNIKRREDPQSDQVYFSWSQCLGSLFQWVLQWFNFLRI